MYRAGYTFFTSNKMIYKRDSHYIAVVTLINTNINFDFVQIYLSYLLFVLLFFGPKFTLGPEIQFLARNSVFGPKFILEP